MISFARRASEYSLYGLILVFPFSVAVSNVFVSFLFVSSILCGSFLDGVKLLWARCKDLLVPICAIVVLAGLGLVWTSDVRSGMEVLGHFWMFFMLPLFLGVLKDENTVQKVFHMMLFALTVNLFYSLVQMLGVIPGKDMFDPAGHMGRISFGAIYSIYAGYLFHRGMLYSGQKRWLCWLLVILAVLLVCSNKGRTGYVLMILSLSMVSVFHLKAEAKRVIFFMAFVLALGSFQVYQTFGMQRIHHMIDTSGVSPGGSSDISTSIRMSLLQGSLEAWQTAPWFGHGTGVFDDVFSKTRAYAENPLFPILGKQAHAHNLYAQYMVQWGVLGVFTVMWFFFAWFVSGARHYYSDMSNPFGMFSMVAAMCMGAHAFTSNTIEEHFTGFFIIFSIGFFLASRQLREDKKT